MLKIRKEIEKLLNSAGVKNANEFSIPPKPEMGDFSFPIFTLAKAEKKNPTELSKEVAEKINVTHSKYIKEVKAFGPYVNFYLDSNALAEFVSSEIKKQGEKYGSNYTGKGKKILTEFAHPNTHKAFHIGHLRNILTGESISRLLENNGYNVTRVNYQGDVGLHIAKALYGIEHMQKEYEAVKDKDIHDRVTFLGKAYAIGSQAFEKDEQIKEKVLEYNEKIYTKGKTIQEMYETTRAWSLEYFDFIYNRVGVKFERLYFESEVFMRGTELVNEFSKKGIFKESEGAIIFEGSKYGLHDRVFINSKGYATYEGKEMGLAELQFKEYNPDQIIHITGKEQADYFKVVFKAIEKIFPKTSNKEKHLTYGWVSLKSGKMSSRTGEVVLGEWLLDEVHKKIAEIMKNSEILDKENIIKQVALSAVKYSLLKTGVQNDTSFDINESISTSGNSGPYLEYICARIKSILRKVGKIDTKKISFSKIKIHKTEKQLLVILAEYPDIARIAGEEYDPSKVAQHLFVLGQAFNSFYNECPVVESSGALREFRLELIKNVLYIMEHGLYLIGVDVVEEM